MAFNYTKNQPSNTFDNFFSGRKGIEIVDTSILANIEKCNDLVREGKYGTDAWAESFEKLPKNIKSLYTEADHAALAIQNIGGKTYVAATGIEKMKLSMKAFAVTAKAAIIQFAAIAAAAWFVSKAFAAVQKWWYENVDTLKNLRGRAEEANSALEATQNEIKNINDELETTQARIDELQAKGSLSFVEQDELKRLKEQNELLEKQLKLKQAVEKKQQQEANEANVEVIDRLQTTLAGRSRRYDSAKAAYDNTNANYQKQMADNPYADPDSFARPLTTASNKLKDAEDDYRSTVEELGEYLYNTNPAALIGEDLEQYNQALKDYAYGLWDLGDITDSEYVETVLSDAEYKQMLNTMQELAETGVETGDSVLHHFSEPVKEAFGVIGQGDEAIVSAIQSMRSVPDVLDSISKMPGFDTLQNKIDEIVNTDFEITEYNIEEFLGDSVIETAKKMGIATPQIVAYFKSIQDAAEDIDIKDVTDNFKTIEENISSLEDAYKEFRDNNGEVSDATLAGLAEEFSSLNSNGELDNLIKILGDASSSVSEVESAMDRLVDSYFNQESVLKTLNEEYKDLHINRLKQLGVSNAEAVVEYKLAMATLQNADASAEAKQEAAELAANTWDVVSALDNEAMAALSAGDKLDTFASYQDYAAGNNFADVINGHATALLNVAIAAGEGAENLARYIEILGRLAELEDVTISAKKDGKYKKMGQGMDAAQTEKLNLLRELSSIADKAETEYKDIFKQNTVYSPEYEKSGGDKGDPEKEEYDKEKKRLDNLLERNKISYRKYYNDLKDLGNEHFKKGSENMREHYATLADVRRDAYAKYQGDLDKDLESGIISLQTYYYKSKALSKEWLDGRKANEEDYKEAVEAIYDAVNDAWGDRISQMETRLERMTLDKNWEPGKTEADYWNKMLEELEQDYINGLFDSTDEYYDHRYDLLKKLDEAKKESWENELDAIQESKDSIQDLIDLVSDMMKHELEEQIDALEKQKDLYSEIVDEKKKSLDLTREENEYQKQLEEYNRDLTELQAKAAVLALDDSREGKAQYAAIMEQIREKQNEIQSSQSDHTYDATTEALDAAQSAYEEKIEKQVSDIQALMEEAGPWLERVYERIEQTPPSKLLADLTRYNYYHGTGMDSDVQRIWAASEGLLTSFDSNVPKILAYLETQEKTLQAQIDASGSDSGSDLSDNYVSDLNKKVQASVTRNQSDATNMGLLDDVRAQYGSGWYDTQNKVIYLGEDGDRRVSAGAANLIQQMESVKNSKAKKSAKEKQLNELLTKLKRKWGYGDAHIEWDGSTPHLYKTAGKSEKWQIFHDGYTRGYVGQSGATYTPDAKQRELLALLEAGELVVNKTQQGYLLSQLQTLQTLSDGLRKLQLDSVPGDTYGVGEINIEVNAPITITGSADADTIKELEKFKKNLSNDVLGEVTSAMKRKGYGGNTAVNARKK